MNMFESRLNKILNEVFHYQGSEQGGDEGRGDEYQEHLRLSDAPIYLWAYYLGGYKKTPLGQVPHLVPYQQGQQLGLLSDGKVLKVAGHLERAYQPQAQQDLIDWLSKSLNKDVRNMKVYQVLRLVRQYTETPQSKIERIAKSPWKLFHQEDQEDQEEDDEGLGLSGDWWK